VTCNGNHMNVFRQHQQQACKIMAANTHTKTKNVNLDNLCCTYLYTKLNIDLGVHTPKPTQRLKNLTILNFVLSYSCTLTTMSSFYKRDIWRKFNLYDAEFMKGTNVCTTIIFNIHCCSWEYFG